MVRYRRKKFSNPITVIVVVITTTADHNHSIIMTSIIVIVRILVRLYETFQNSYRASSVKS